MGRMKESTKLRRRYYAFIMRPVWMDNTVQKGMEKSLRNAIWHQGRSFDIMKRASEVIKELHNGDLSKVPDLSEDEHNLFYLELLLEVVKGRFLNGEQLLHYSAIYRDN